VLELSDLSGPLMLALMFCVHNPSSACIDQNWPSSNERYKAGLSRQRSMTDAF
jgi:hypothetical protein